MEVHSYKVSEEDVVSYRTRNGYPYAILENVDGRFLFCGGFHGDVQNMDIQLQAIEAFRLAMEILDKEGFATGNIIRQWNYIEKITDFDGVDQHYQMFNNVRSNFYKSADWNTGYPAATGIGTDLGGVLVVSENLPLLGCSTTYHPITCKILFRETNPRRDKNGTEPQENKIKNALLRISVSEYLLLRCKGTNLSRQKRIKTHKVHIYSAFFIFLYHGG